MNYSEVKSLLDAGFTADEIRAMMGNNPQNPQNNPQPEPEQKPEPKDLEQDPEPKQPEPDKLEPEQEEKFQQLSQNIEKLIKTIQVSNLQNRSFDTPAQPDIDTQVDKIMAGIIRPQHEKEDSKK